MNTTRVILWVCAGAVMAGAYAGYVVVFARPMAAAKARLAQSEDRLGDLDARLRDGRSVKKELTGFAGKTLGKAVDAVSHQYSASLRQLAERNGLTRVVVTHREPESQMNPLTKASGIRPEAVKKVLRGRPDFQLMRGTVTGQGTLEQVLRTMAEVDAQTWCRIDSFTLTPMERGEKFTIDMGVSAPMLSDLVTSEPAEIALPGARDDAGFVLSAITTRNVFLDPKKPVTEQAPVVVAADPPKGPVTAPVPDSALPPPPPPYAEWKLTGVVVSHGTGVQVFMSNTRTNAKVTVLQGAKVEDAILVDGLGEVAVFEIAGAKFRVRINQTLAEREPVG